MQIKHCEKNHDLKIININQLNFFNFLIIDTIEFKLIVFAI